ncbi:MAG: aminotransferase class V-fold PLP-dependent enzyme [Clostridiales bacterium]|nr:aminotransferase class V-fold PLP-dependent enzyme [Clostridiales bacterium]
MFYFDNAATSWPKPATVINEAVNCIVKHGANPNRSGHTMAHEAGQKILNTRKRLCFLFNTDDPFEYIFTHNTTYALNFAIKGVLKSGMHAIATSLEHNSVLRPLFTLKDQGVSVDIVNCDRQGMISPKQFEAAIKSNTRLVVITHCSNVLGTIQPIEELCQIAHKHSALVLIDAAQSAGCIPLDIKNTDADMVAMPAHKSLYGLQGNGVLYVKKGTPITPLIQGGTGSESKILTQPDIMPDMLEAGTQNFPGIAALGEAIRFIQSVGINKIRNHEVALAKYFRDGLSKIDSVKTYGRSDIETSSGIVTFNIDNKDPSTVESILDKKYSIAVRSGLHCAPLAHMSIGTYETGAVRFSFGYYNDEKQIEYAIRAIREIASGK